MRAPTRRTSTLGFSLAVWARAAAATTMTRRMRRILITGDALRGPGGAGDTYDLRPRVLHLHFARHQADERADDVHQHTHPDPTHQREDVGLNHGALVIVAHAAEIEIQVFVRALAD